MNMKTYTIPDRRPTTPGPWDNEPDKAQWIDPDTNLDCLIVRNHNGNLCGYVGVPPNHPWHGRYYRPLQDKVEVHGGLNYSEACDGDEETGICHTPEPGRPDNVWWFGFDCGHAFDIQPLMDERLASLGLNPIASPELEHYHVYRDFAYVQDQVKHLAAQIAAP